jgi:hypothetical protein
MASATKQRRRDVEDIMVTPGASKRWRIIASTMRASPPGGGGRDPRT